MSIVNEHGEINSVSVIIPTLNEVSNVRHVFPYIPEFIDEIVVVDGGSIDGTVDEILKFRKDAKIVIDKAHGKGIALRRGFETATGDLIVMMDADGSHDPKELPRLIEPVLNGHDVSHGSRFLPGGGSDDFTPFRRFGNKIFVAMVNKLYGVSYTDLCYGYRAYKKSAAGKIFCKSSGFEIETEQSILTAKAGLKVKEVPSFEYRRINGDSRLNSFSDGLRIFTLIIREYMKDVPKRNERR